MTNTTNATPASATAARGPISRDENSTAPHTIVTLAPDTAVRCVKPAARNSRLVTVLTAEVSPSTSAGSIAAWSAGSTRRAVAANAARTACAARCTGPARPIVGWPTAFTTATVRSCRVGRVILARKRTGWPTITALKSRAGAKTTTRPDIWFCPSCCNVARNISRPRPTDSALSLGVTTTCAAVPNTAVMGWRATALARNAIANPNPAPTTPTATTPTPMARIRGLRCPVRHSRRPNALPTAHTDPTTLPIGHMIPAAVTVQLVNAAGTRRASSRAVAASPPDGCCTGLRHEPAGAAFPDARGRCRRPRRAGRRW